MKLPKRRPASWKPLSESVLPGMTSRQRPSTLSSLIAAGYRQVISESETAPLCECGCERSVTESRGIWNKYLLGHQMLGRSTMSLAGRERIRQRMIANNPMRRPDVANRVSMSQRGKTKPRSATWAKNVAAAARRRMLSDRNPMKQPGAHKAAMAKVLSRQKSLNEVSFEKWLSENSIHLRPTGDGTFWIGRRNPDYRVVTQRKVVELTMKECFIGRRKIRTVDGYGMESIKHYRSKGWECLVVFRKDHRQHPPAELKDVLQNFMSPESAWSAVWHYDRLIQYGVAQGLLPYTTSPAHPRKRMRRKA